MRTAALLGLGISERDVKPFRIPKVEIEVREELLGDEYAALVFGGDGTIHRHLRPLIEHKLPLLPVPVGSGNDFAGAIGIRSVDDALTAWRAFCSGAGNIREIDAGLIRALGSSSTYREARNSKTEICGPPLETGNAKPETYFCNIAGVGLDSEANRLANALPRWLRAHGGYILSAARAILTFPPVSVTVRAAEAEPIISGPAMLVAIANTTSYGSGMRIAPRAELADGLVDVCFVRRAGRIRLLRSIPRVFRGDHLSMPEVSYFQAPRIRIDADRSLALYADGEFVCQSPLEIEVVPRALRVITAIKQHISKAITVLN